MKHTNKFLIAVATFALSSTAFAAGSSHSIGQLEAKNGVQISSASGSLPIEDTYAFFSGDKIVTDKTGIAGLTLTQDGGVYVGKESIASVEKSAGGYAFEVEKGTLGFDLQEGVPFQLVAGDMTVTLAEGHQRATGVVVLGENGELKVQSQTGELQVVSSDGEILIVPEGEALSYTATSAELVPVQVTEGVAPALLIGGAVVGGAIIIDALDDDDEETPTGAADDTGSASPSGG